VSTITRERLHELVDALADADLDRAGRLLAALAADDPVGLSLALAPADDEPTTDAEVAALDEAYEDLRAGRTLTTEELRRELGL
jgi:hypothetical protein